MRRRLFVCAALLVLAGGLGPPAGAQVYEEASLREVLRSVEQSTSYRFLYRDALVAGRTVSVNLHDDPVEDLAGALRALGLGVRVDDERRQVLIYRNGGLETQAGAAGRRTPVSGYVLDDATGARLPYATVSWLDEEGTLRGVATNEAGRFEASLVQGREEQLTVSYLGYESTVVQLDVPAEPIDIAVRLEPRPVVGGEVVVSGTMLHTDLDTTWQHLIRPGVLAPLGEASVLRSLATLPSVALSPAMSDGLSIRGSKADGFQVLLDGLPIYSRSHMFGLFDAFNEDALQAVAFYYGVAPASYQAPPGGTMSLLTRTGSQERFSGAFGGSNTSLKGTLEGPILGGKGSWLVSGRKSYLGEVGWFGNETLIAQGLDAGRETSLETGPRFEVLSGDAAYHDFHAKLFLEGARGNSFTLTGYSGGDHALQTASRRLPLPGSLGGRNSAAESSWGSEVIGGRYHQSVGTLGFLSILTGWSRFDSGYRNDSVVARTSRSDNPGNSQAPALRIDQFRNDNVLTQVRLAPQLTFDRSGIWSVGADLNVYDMSYTEATSRRPDYGLQQSATQLDLFAGWSSARSRMARLDVGLRSHYYSAGDYLRLSPRFDLQIHPESPVSVSVGYSRNLQFLHQLEIEPVGESAPEVWILSSDRESPGSVDYVTTGIYVRPAHSLFLQVEAYLKKYSNLRLHETAGPDPSGAGLRTELDNPWLTDVDGRSRGLEAMLRHSIGPVTFSHAYSLSRTVYENPRVLEGREFLVSWDRTHQYTTSAYARLGALEGTATWSIATGTPNTLRFADGEAERLPIYHRLDVGVSWEKPVGPRTISASISVYNLLDRQNVWYRSLVPVRVGGTIARPEIEETRSVDVYDLGLHPSFSLGVRF